MQSLVKISLLAILFAGCADEGASEETEELGPSTGTCPTGKCDGLADTLKDYYDDMRSIRLDDLAGLGVNIASKELNDYLGDVPFVDIKIGDTTLFGTPRELFEQVIVEDLSKLKAGLTEGLGEHAFATYINGLRLKTLGGSEAVFAESSFKLGAQHGASWGLDLGEILGSVGFNGGGDLEAIIIAPYRDNLEAAWKNPLGSLQAMRGFVLPQDWEDVREMHAGESMALRGNGGLGFNLGLGIPIIIGTVADYVTLRSRISAAARVSLKGVLDVQLIRGEGHEAFVDVGLSRAYMDHFELALSTGWGVSGLPEVELDLGPVDLDLAEIAGKALEKHLNRKLSVFSAQVSQGSEESRMTVARFRFNLSKESEENRQALAQALRADLRLAQALANRPESGIVQDLDLSKDTRSESSYLGFRFLSMNFFKSQNFNTGSVHIEADGAHQTLLFSELERSGGLFFTERSTKWRQLTSLLTRDGRLMDASNNARLTIREGDRFMDRDTVLDHVDPLLMWMIGFEQTLEIAHFSDQLYAFVDDFCPSPSVPISGEPDEEAAAEEAYKACVATLYEQGSYLDLMKWGRDLYSDLAQDLPFDGFDERFTSASELARTLFDMKMGVSGIHQYPAFFRGPDGSILSQIRFSQEAIQQIFNSSPGQLRLALEQVLRLMRADREDEPQENQDDARKYAERKARNLDATQAEFKSIQSLYQQLNTVAGLKFTGEAPLGEHAHLLLVPVSQPGDLDMATVAEQKGDLLEQLFPRLEERIGSLGVYEEFLLGYSLLQLVDPPQVELLLSYQFKGSDSEDFQDYVKRIYTRGVSPLIETGRFILEELIP